MTMDAYPSWASINRQTSKKITEIIFLALESDHYETVLYYLENAANINVLLEVMKVLILDRRCTDKTRRWAMQWAVAKMNVVVIWFIFQYSNCIFQYSPCFTIEDHISIIKDLLARGADINTNGWAIQWAARKGQLDFLEFLIQNGVDVDLGCPNALIYATMNGHIDILRRFLEAGVDVNAWGVEVLKQAARKGYIDIVKLFLEEDIDLNSGGEFHHGKFYDDTSPLHDASRCGRVEIAQLLIEKGANVDLHGEEHGGPLLMAISNGHTKTVQLLLDNGAGNIGNWPHDYLLLAACKGRTDIVRLLLQSIFPMSLPDAKETVRDALYLAAHNNKPDVIQLFVDQGADIHDAIQHLIDNSSDLMDHLEEIAYVDDTYDGDSLERDRMILKALLKPLQRIHSTRVIERAWLEYAYRPGNIGFTRCMEGWKDKVLSTNTH